MIHTHKNNKINTKDPHWDELYNYVRSEIMGYDETKKLPKYMILRLIGMTQGKFMANNKVKPMGEYSFYEMLITFKMHKHLLVTSSAHIETEQGRFNYMMAIVESKINDICTKLRDKKKSESKLEKVSVDVDSSRAEYKKRSKDRKNISELW